MDCTIYYTMHRQCIRTCIRQCIRQCIRECKGLPIRQVIRHCIRHCIIQCSRNGLGQYRQFIRQCIWQCCPIRQCIGQYLSQCIRQCSRQCAMTMQSSILQTLAPLHGVDAPSELLHMRSAVGFIYFVSSHWSIRQSLVPRHVWIHHQTCYTCGAPWVWFTVYSSASARGGYTIRVVTHAERRGFICLDCNTRRFGGETRTIACRMSTHMLPSLVWEALAVTSCRSHETALCRPFSHLRVFVRLVQLLGIGQDDFSGQGWRKIQFRNIYWYRLLEKGPLCIWCCLWIVHSFVLLCCGSITRNDILSCGSFTPQLFRTTCYKLRFSSACFERTVRNVAAEKTSFEQGVRCSRQCIRECISARIGQSIRQCDI